MAEEKEKFEGQWRGKKVRFTREFRGYRLSDAECKRLCRDEPVSIYNLRSKKGNTYGVVVALEEAEYRNRKYVRIGSTGFAPMVPSSWCQHEFTDEEKELLDMGEMVTLTDCVSRKGSTFSADVTWEDVDGEMRIVPHFDSK